MKYGPAGFQLALTDAELDHRVSVQNIDGTASINESPGKLARVQWCRYDCIHHERIIVWVGHNARVVFWTPCYDIVRPVHPLRDCWHGGIACLLSGSPTALVIWLASEDH